MACRSLEKGAKALESLQVREPQVVGGTLSLVELDITNDASITAAVEKITADFNGVLDVLINNAGIVVTTPTQGRRSELVDTFNTNAASPLVLTELLLPLLKKSHDPRIINVSSELGSISERSDATNKYYGMPGEAYRMSKCALNMATACMSAMYKGWGCKVWSYCPGFVVTNLTGEESRQRRIEMGAESAETSAEGLKEIVEGKTDGEVGLFVTKYGKVYGW
jgi:NAD(P)-dependent dehydrogenase (short-subunit alcohol dehydrogenase family)